ncbi:MAG: hypothetical protein IIX14_05905 [Clostridia bacterium]|nr:hypothetical protein [Clostridia bacterium]
MKKFISIFLCIAILCSLCSCSFSLTEATFTMGVLEGAKSLDPLESQSEIERIISTNCFEGLLRFDSNGKINLAGATAYTIEKNGLSYIFKLNPDAKWYISKEIAVTLESLGLTEFEESITAEDYVFGFERFKQLHPQKVSKVKNVAAVDSHTLEITLSQIDHELLYKLAALPIYPCDEEFYTSAGRVYATTPETVLSNGAYYIEQSSPAETIIKRNPHHNGNIQILNKHIVLYTTGVKENLAERFKDGSYNLLVADTREAVFGQESTSAAYDSIWGLAFNCKSKLGASGSFRTALLSGISDISTLELPEFALERADFVFPHSATNGDVTCGDFTWEKTTFKGDPKKAAETLDALMKNYKVTEYKVTFVAPAEMETTAKKIVEDWKTAFGEKIEIKLTLFDRAQVNEVMAKGEYDLGILPLSNQTNTAAAILDSFSQAPCNCEVRSLKTLQNGLSSVANENAAVFMKADKLVIESGVFVPLFYTGKVLFINSGYKGVYIADGGNLVYFHEGEES